MVLLFCVGYSYAQKGKATQAISYFTSGKLDQAKKLIDEAMNHESCADWDKGYFTKGQIYQAIFESPLPEYKKLASNALGTAWDAYQKVIQLDAKKKYTEKLETQYKNLIIDYTTSAVDFYNTGKYKEALAAFKRVLEIENSPIITGGKPAKVDTAVIFNAAVSAHKAGDWPEAEYYYKETLKYNYEAARTYAMLASILKEQGKDEEALKYLHQGYELYPDNSHMLVELINYYLLGGEPEKAEKYLDAAIKQNPTNASFYRAKGTLFEKMKQPEKAEEMYIKTLELDPKDFLAQYNLGNIKLSRVIEYHRKVNDIDDAKQYNKEMEKVYAQYAEVIPYFEKALELNPKEKNTMTTLRELYYKLRNTNPIYQKKYDEIIKLLEQQ